jgi:small redox-active disulfide protein 2
MLKVKVLGPGCPNCKKVGQLAKLAAESLGVEAEFTKITDYNEISTYDVIATPGLVINEKLVSAGRIPRQSEIAAWLTEAMEIA